MHWTDEAAAAKRFAEAIGRVRELMPEAEMAVISPAEIAFRCHGLEFAKARLAHHLGSLRSTPEIVFGVGADERVLVAQNAEAFRRLVYSIGEVRHAGGPRDHALWRLHPERWLESLVVQDVSEVDERLDASSQYSQVPAFSAADRAMIDVLTVTSRGQAGGGGTEGRRRYPLAAARSGLLVARGLAPCARRVPTLRIFSRAGVIAGTSVVISGSARTARASLNRHSCCTTSRPKSNGWW